MPREWRLLEAGWWDTGDHDTGYSVVQEEAQEWWVYPRNTKDEWGPYKTLGEAKAAVENHARDTHPDEGR